MAYISRRYRAGGNHHRHQASPLMIFVAFGALAFVLAANPACGNQPPVNSGIEGDVSLGPISPVSRPGEVNSRPFAAEVIVRRASDNHIAAEFRSADDGTFRVELPPGRYLVEPQQGDPLPIASPQEVTVVAGRFTQIHVDYDSGIR